MPDYTSLPSMASEVGCSSRVETARDPGYPAPPRATNAPYQYDSWESMTNIEKFDKLRNEVMRLTELVEASSDSTRRDLMKILNDFEQHSHAQDGAIMVKYSRSTSY